jgi:DNA repair protein RadC
VLSLAEGLIKRHEGLGGLARLSFAELTREKGLGDAKAAELQAAFELARRLNALQPEERPYVRSPQDVNNLLGPDMAMLDQEELRVLMLSTRNKLMGISDVYKGNVNSAVVRASEVYRDAVRRNAPCIIVVHNHPSGDPTPSADDIGITKQLVEPESTSKSNCWTTSSLATKVTRVSSNWDRCDHDEASAWEAARRYTRE